MNANYTSAKYFMYDIEIQLEMAYSESKVKQKTIWCDQNKAKKKCYPKN